MQDWLILFLTRWHHHMLKLPFGEAPQPGHLDPQLERSPVLSSLTRVVYAFLRCPLLSSSGPPSDQAAYLRLLWTHLPPDSLFRAIHPILVSFDDPESDKHASVPLSHRALTSSSGRIILMDAFHVILVMYRTAALSELQFPPPANSNLRSLVAKLAASRGIAPHVVYCTEGDTAAQQLEDYLIDEPVVGAQLVEEAGAEAAKLGFAGWLHHLETEVSLSLERANAG
jgi:hypothetical protein